MTEGQITLAVDGAQITFRIPNLLLYGQFKRLRNLAEKRLPEHEFLATFLQAYLPSEFESLPLQWPSEMLSDITFRLLLAGGYIAPESAVDTKDMCAVKPILDNFILEQTEKMVVDFRLCMDESATYLVNSILELDSQVSKVTFRSVIEGLRASINNIIAAFPYLFETDRHTDRIRRASEEIGRAGFGFSTRLLDPEVLASFFEAEDQPGTTLISERMYRLTCSESCREMLMANIMESKVMRRRQRILNSALKAHVARDYALSIPVFLSQLEGLISDALILNGTLLRYRGDLYMRKPDGGFRLGKKGEPIRIRGLDSLVGASDWYDSKAMGDVAELLVDDLAPGRNRIVHGQVTSYPRRILSTKAILVLIIVVLVIRNFEEGMSEEYNPVFMLRQSE